MMDINTYRSRIGLFSPKYHKKKFLFKRDYYNQFRCNENNTGKNIMKTFQISFKFVLFLGLLYVENKSEINVSTSGHSHSLGMLSTSVGCVGRVCAGMGRKLVGGGTWAGGGKQVKWKQENYSECHSQHAP